MIESTVMPDDARLMSIGLIDTTRRPDVYENFVEFTRVEQISSRNRISRFPFCVQAVVEEHPVSLLVEDAGIAGKSLVPRSWRPVGNDRILLVPYPLLQIF